LKGATREERDLEEKPEHRKARGMVCVNRYAFANVGSIRGRDLKRGKGQIGLGKRP